MSSLIPNIASSILTRLGLAALIAGLIAGCSHRARVENFVDDQAELERIALTEPAADVRQAAVRKVKNPDVLAKVALEDTDTSGWIRYDAVKAISDQQVLAKVAIGDPKYEVRKAALAKITDQSLLADVAVAGKEKWERSSAFEKITNPMAVAKVIVASKHADETKRMLSKLSDQQALAKVAIDTRNSDLAENALQKISDQEALLGVALNSQTLAGRYEVTKKFNPEFKARYAEAIYPKTQARGSEESYRWFMGEFPGTPQAAQAAEAIRTIHYNQALESADIARYVKFLSENGSGPDTDVIRGKLRAAGRWDKARQLGEVALSMGPTPVVSFSGTPFVGGGTTGKLEPAGVFYASRPTEEIDAALKKLKVLLDAGASPSAVRIAPATPDRHVSGDLYIQGSPERPVSAEQKGLTLQQYFKKHNLGEALQMVQRYSK